MKFSIEVATNGWLVRDDEGHNAPTYAPTLVDAFNVVIQAVYMFKKPDDFGAEIGALASAWLAKFTDPEAVAE